MRIFVLMATLAACSSYTPPAMTCRNTCDGCCDESSKCHSGLTDDQCGSGGSDCETCDSTFFCYHLDPGGVCAIKPQACVRTTGTGCNAGSCKGTNGQCFSCMGTAFCTTTPSGCAACGTGNNGVFCCQP